MLATAPRLAIVWDEGYTLGREARVRCWFRALRDPARFAATWRPPRRRARPGRRPSAAARPTEIDTRAELLRPSAWPGSGRSAARSRTAIPRSMRWSGLAGDLLAPGWEALPRARLGPILAFSLTAGRHLRLRRAAMGPLAGAPLAAGAWVLQPQLFGHGHYATLRRPADEPLGRGDPRLRRGGRSRRPARTARPPALGLGRRLRRPGRLGGRHQADRLVPAGPVPGLDGPVPDRRGAWTLAVGGAGRPWRPSTPSTRPGGPTRSAGSSGSCGRT